MAKKGLLSRFRSDSSDNLSEEEKSKERINGAKNAVSFWSIISNS